MRTATLAATLTASALTLAACSADPAPPTGPRTTSAATSTGPGPEPSSPPATTVPGLPFTIAERGTFVEPWAMCWLPDGRALVTQRGGELRVYDPRSGSSTIVTGTPEVHHVGQGGLADVVLGPAYAQDGTIYLSWAQDGPDGTSRAAVGRATLQLAGPEPRLAGLQEIWHQDRFVPGDGHYGHRLAISPDGRTLWVSSGERQKFDPAQDDGTTLGKILRMGLDGTGAQVVSTGHRNPLGLAFDAQGRLWESEMGPRGGDEINLIQAGGNYGWPRASNGSHYDGRDIPDHRPGDGYVAPQVWWNPSISPGSLMIYSGEAFPQWRGDAFVGALSGQALVRVHLAGGTATKGDQWNLGQRIREVEQGPDGAIWLLTDGEQGRLLRLAPVSR
ncbi:PQQ-dependent sugar dehydrogenase [Arsenicicoccus dermatophilus]|uniref:PQQ-dependent sugar dehydrogenase n=1 Tax=Arsenicicoccus dermatophilus TaxID=1076331 RepID=UPI003916D1AB